MRSSPTQRSLALLRRRGLVCAVTEHWNPHVGPHGIRQDLYGWIDLLALDPTTGELIAVQTTSGSNVSKRLDKIRAWPHLEAWLLRHRAVVHGWAKRGERGKRKLWDCREVPVTARPVPSESAAADPDNPAPAPLNSPAPAGTVATHSRTVVA